MALSESNVFGMPTDTINTLQDNLHDRYYSGFPVLKELIQNANDAGASVFKVFKTEGLSDSVNPLLKKKAILVYNDGNVNEENIQGIKWVARGGKIGKPGLIGKFGLGMKSIFHFSDAFFLCAFISGKEIIQLVNPFYDILEKKDPYHPEWGNFPESDEAKLFSHVTDCLKDKKTGKSPKKGLLLWIPLRDESDKENATISESIYTIDKIWNQDSDSLKKSIALSLISLDVSTPCINNSRSLETIEIYNQNPYINLEFKLGSKKITSDGKDYCQVIKTEPIDDDKGNELLSRIIKKNKFDKKFYTDEKLKRHEWSAYTENQKIGLAIAKFLDIKKPRIIVNWCSYLPLDGTDDVEFLDNRIDTEYHIVAHANFSIDSGRRYIDGYSDCCINKESLVDEDFSNIVDNASSQKEWNKILIRYFVLPNILKFAAEKGEPIFFEALYDSLASYSSKLGYFCFDKGIVFKTGKKWEYHKTNSISESGLYLIKRTAENYSEQKNFLNTDCFKTTIHICNYIQSENPNINWSISVAEKTLDNSELAVINRIIADKDYPILLLPSVLDKEYLNSSYRLSNAEIVINFLEEFENELEDKASDIFESICNNDSITKEVSRDIFTNERIKKYVKLFKVTSLDPNETKFNAEGKTFNEICSLSNNSQLFFYVAQNDSKQERELQPIYLLQRMCPNITFYCAGRATAKNQLFLKEDDKDSIYKYITDVDAENPTNEPEIKLLDSIKITSILYAMKQNLQFLEFGNIPVADEFISRTKYLSENDKKEYFDVLRSILLGKVVQDNLYIYKLSSSFGNEHRTEFLYEIISKYSTTEYNDHIIRPGFDYPQSLISVLGIKEITDEDLERKLIYIANDIKKATPEEKEQLSRYIYNEDVFSKLEIQKTISGEFVSLDNSTYHCYLESSDENIRFPSNYCFPDNFKLIRRDNEIHLQSCIQELSYKDIINTILLDNNNSLGTQDGIKLSGFICSLIEKAKGKISQEDIHPNSRKRKWIPDYSHQFFSLDEVIDCLGIDENLISLCSGVIHASKINENYFVCREFFVREKQTALKQLLSHPDKDSTNKWPWFNFQSYPILKTDEAAKELLPYLLKTGDASIRIINEVLKGNGEAIIEALRNIDINSYIQNDAEYVSRQYLRFIFNLGNSFNVGDIISENLLSLIEGAFENIREEEILDIIEKAKSNKSQNIIKLPSEGKTWNTIHELSNFKITIPDLKLENTLSRRICEKFPAIERRMGADNNGHIIQIDELIKKLDTCKNPKLWGVFCYLISNDVAKRIVSNYGRLIEKNTIETLKSFHLPRITNSEISLFRTEDNYCESLTSSMIKLKDAKEMDTVFYNAPTFNNGIIQVEMFDNFSAFSDTSIENAIRQLFSILIPEIPDDTFFEHLQNPSQEDITIVINMIFATVFDTLKRLKLDTKAGQNNQIAEEYQKYMKACGERDSEAMGRSWDAVRTLIETNSGGIQSKIRERVKDFIQEAEYQERCILFELFQNGDDAYAQQNNNLKKEYFNVISSDDTLVIEHNGRPINEYKDGGLPEYKSDLANMLIIGWSDKPHMTSSEMTGKFGYGFKTVYLISDEPHVKSGDYDFVVKSALYPYSVPEKRGDYTDKTIITLNLNDNGLRKKDSIISDFKNSASFLAMFSKRIREINIDGIPFFWKPNKTTTLSKFAIETDGNILLFKTIPSTIQEPLCQLASFAFKINGDVVVPLEESISKMWCLAPLSDFKGLYYAINARFKTNTGRQTLACENPDNHKIINTLSKLFIDALFELKDSEIFGCYFNSLINIILDSKTKSKINIVIDSKATSISVLGSFSDYAIQSSLSKNLLPNGTGKILNYNGQNIYSLSAHPFGSHIALQYKYINAMNDFIKDCDETDVVTTQIVADLLREQINSPITEMKKIITLLDCLLNKNANNINKQKEILLKFRDSSLYDYVKQEEEELTSCRIKDADGSIKMIRNVVEVSPEYGEAASILTGLYSPYADAVKQHYQGSENEKPDSASDPDVSYGPQYSIEDVYEWWYDEKKAGDWENDVEKYYEWKHFPSINDFRISSEELFNISDGTIPKGWCLLLWIAAAQSMPYNWGNRDASNYNGIKYLTDKGLFDEFCNGDNLQDIYNHYLDKSSGEERIRLFEMLLRIHKYRRGDNFSTFYDLLKNLPNGIKNNDAKVKDLLVKTDNEELTGCGINLPSAERTFGLGYRLIIQNLALCDFWKDSSLEEMKALFMSFRGYKQSEINLAGKPLEKEFYSCLDLPFLLYENRGQY